MFEVSDNGALLVRSQPVLWRGRGLFVGRVRIEGSACELRLHDQVLDDGDVRLVVSARGGSKEILQSFMRSMT